MIPINIVFAIVISLITIVCFISIEYTSNENTRLILDFTLIVIIITLCFLPSHSDKVYNWIFKD